MRSSTIFVSTAFYESDCEHFCNFSLSMKHTFSSCPEEIDARVSSRMCSPICSLLFGIARAVQDLCIRNRESLVSEAFQMSHLG